MIDNITLLGSGLNTDDDITTIPNGDSRHRFNVVYGSDGDYGSLVGIKDSVSVPLLPEWNTWANKACIGAVEYIHGNSFIFLLYGETTNLATTIKHVAIGEVKSNNSVVVIGNLPPSMLSKYTPDTTIEPYIIDKFLGFTDKINEPILINIERAKLYVQHSPVPYYNPITVYNFADKVYFKGRGLYRYKGTPAAGVELDQNPSKWEFIGEMYESFDLKAISRVKPSFNGVVNFVVENDDLIYHPFSDNVQYKFSVVYEYKDKERSVLSQRTRPVVIKTNGITLDGVFGNKLKVVISGIPIEVNKVILLSSSDDVNWFVVDSLFNNKLGYIELYFTGQRKSAYDINESNRLFDFIANQVDESTCISNRIVDAGLHEGLDFNEIDFDITYKYNLIPSNISIPSLPDIGYTLESFNPSLIRFKALSQDQLIKAGTKIIISYPNLFQVEYTTDGTESIESLYLKIPKNKYPVTDRYNTFAYVEIETLVDPITHTQYSVLKGMIDEMVDQDTLLTTYPIADVPIVIISSNTVSSDKVAVHESLKNGATHYFGISLTDGKVFTSVKKIVSKYLPTLAEIRSENIQEYQNAFISNVPVDTRPDNYYAEALISIKTPFPIWCVGYSIVHFGSDISSFTAGMGDLVSFQNENPASNYDISLALYYEKLLTTPLENRILYTIEVGDYVRIDSRSTNTITTEPYKITEIKDVTNTAGKTIPIIRLDRNLLPYTASVRSLEIFKKTALNKTIGKEQPVLHNASEVTNVKTGCFDSYIRYIVDVTPLADKDIDRWEYQSAYSSFTSNTTSGSRPVVYDDSYRMTYLKGKLRNGGNYIDNTQINNLCRFDVLDFNNVDDQWGKITQMYPVGQNLRVRQERNYSTVYIGSIQSVSPDGTTQTLQSSKFLGAVYAADAGVGSKYGGYYTIGTQEFTFDDATKNIYRTSQGGIFSISGKAFTQEGANDYKIHKLITDISLNNATRHINFGYDNENDLLLATFIGTENKTIGFHIPTQRWLSFYGFTPERYISSGINNYYFSGGALFQMNKGLKLPVEYDFTTNVNSTTPKKFRSMAIVGDIANFICECTIPSGSNYRDMYTRTSKIVSKENKKYIEIPRNMKTSSNTPSVMEKETGIEMRGYAMNVKMTGDLKLTSINVNAD